MSGSQLVAISVGALAGGGFSPYLASLTLTTINRRPGWWRPVRVSGRRLVTVLLIAVVLSGLAGAAAHWSSVLPAAVALAMAGGVLAVVDLRHHKLPDPVLMADAVVVLDSPDGVGRH